MSLAELIPAVRSLSWSDKLRLIQWLAADLAEVEDPLSYPDTRTNAGLGQNGIEDDGGTRQPVHAKGLRNALGPREEDKRLAGQGAITDPNYAGSPSTGPGQSYPYWSPDREYEAAAMLLKMLEAEKPAS